MIDTAPNNSPANTPIVVAQDVTKTYGTADAPVHALRGVSLTVKRGERIALLGKSGSGKSTLLGLIGSLDQATSGSIVVDSHQLNSMTPTEASRHRLNTVGMVFQAYNLINSKTALQNVQLPMLFAGLASRARRDAARAALEAVGLSDRLEHRPNELSGGEQQRVAIARALINRPRLLLADEPTGNLDSATSGEVIDLLLENIERDNMTLILVTHDEELAARCADRIVRINDGQIVETTCVLPTSSPSD